MNNLTSLEAKIQRAARANNMKLNNYEWHTMANAVENLVDRVDRYKFLSQNELGEMMHNAFKDFRNPEKIGMVREAIEDLKILGFRFNPHDICKK